MVCVWWECDCVIFPPLEIMTYDWWEFAGYAGYYHDDVDHDDVDHDDVDHDDVHHDEVDHDDVDHDDNDQSNSPTLYLQVDHCRALRPARQGPLTE